jgi:hypothetical protein
LAGLLLLLSVALLARAGREGLSRRDAVGLGLAGGLAALNRPMVVPLIVVLSLAVGWRAWQAASGAEARRAWRLAGALMLLGLATALAYNAVAFGSPFRTGYEGDHGFQTFPYSGEPGFSTPLLVGLYGNLFSAGRSVFLYSPAALVAVFGLGRLWRTRPDYARPAVVAVAYYLLVWSKWWSWYGGAGLGNRALLPAVLLLMPAVAAVWDAAAGWRDGRRLATLAVILVGALVQTPSVLLSCGDVYSAVEGFDPRTYRNEYRIHYVPHTSPLAVGARLLIERGLQDNDLFLARWAPAEKEGAVVTALFGAVMAAGLGLAIRTARRASATPRGQPPRPGDTRGG